METEVKRKEGKGENNKRERRIGNERRQEKKIKKKKGNRRGRRRIGNERR